MERERIKPLIITDSTGKEYTLEFNRASIKLAEQMGFKIKSFDETPETSFELLWVCSFKMHHPEVSVLDADKLIDQIPTDMRGKVFSRLFDLYLAGTESLSDENPKVTVIL